MRNLVELFFAIVPIYYATKLQTVPQLSVIFHNDCMFLAHHLLLLSNIHSTSLITREFVAVFVDLIPKLRNCGVQSFTKQMVKIILQKKNK